MGDSKGGVARLTSSTDDDAVVVEPSLSLTAPYRTLSRLGRGPSGIGKGGASRPNPDATVCMDPFENREALDAMEALE